MAKVITFFNHKGGVGKTTLVHNIGFILADKGQKVLLIDADPQMNLTAAMYGLSTSIEYSENEDSKWNQNINRYISFTEYLDLELKSQECEKTLFRIPSQKDSNGFLDLISGAIKLFDWEADLYGVIKNKNDFTKDIPAKFEKAIKKHKNDYDFILIDTSPSANSIINGLIMMSTDYFIAPVSPSFFSLQAIDNLSAIFNNWIKLLGEYETTKSNVGLSFRPKFLGLVVQMAKRFNGGAINENEQRRDLFSALSSDENNSAELQDETKFSKSAEKWIKDVNNSVRKFQKFAFARDMSISENDFLNIFGGNQTPFIIQKCCDFTYQLKSVAEKAGIPIVHLTQDICDKYKDSSTKVDITKEKGQYKLSFDSIYSSYNKIADGLIKLKNYKLVIN